MSNRYNLPPVLLIILSVTWICASCTSVQQVPLSQSNTELNFSMPEAISFDPATQIVLTPVVEDLDRPVFITHAGDGSGRLFIIEKEGRIRIFADGALLETPFLDISDRVNDGGNEQGLLGLAFVPNFAESRLFFVNYTDEDGNTALSRFQVTDDPNLADAESESILLQVDQPARNHNGGMIAFGPDGMLWIGMGDGGGSGDRYGNGQNPETLLGKILRIDVTSDPAQSYTVPADNPWLGDDDSVRNEVWAIGFRNPWRFSFDRQSGDLWVGDVGQNQYEEVNRVPSGKGGFNFGWPLMEGSHCYKENDCKSTGMVPPIAEYEHGTGGCSVTGGYVYRGKEIVEFDGAYFYGDYCSGRIWAVWPDATRPDTTGPDTTGMWQNAELLDSDLTISSFGEDEAGELYIVSYGGAIYKLERERG